MKSRTETSEKHSGKNCDRKEYVSTIRNDYEQKEKRRKTKKKYLFLKEATQSAFTTKYENN